MQEHKNKTHTRSKFLTMFFGDAEVRKTHTRNYFEATLSINIFLIIIFIGSAFFGGKDIANLPEVSNITIEEKTDTAIENNKIQYLSGYVSKLDTFDASIIVDTIQSKDLPSIKYESKDGVYYPFKSLIGADGSVTGLILDLKDSSKANLLKDTLSLIESKNKDKVNSSEGYATVEAYRDYLAKQLGMTSDEAKTVLKYSNGLFNFRDDSSFMFKAVYVFIAFSTAMIVFILINIIGSLIGLHLCKKDEKTQT